MNFFENALCELIELEEELDRNASDLVNDDLEPEIIMDRALELREIVEEFKKIHVGLVKQDRLMNELAEIQL